MHTYALAHYSLRDEQSSRPPSLSAVRQGLRWSTEAGEIPGSLSLTWADGRVVSWIGYKFNISCPAAFNSTYRYGVRSTEENSGGRPTPPYPIMKYVPSSRFHSQNQKKSRGTFSTLQSRVSRPKLQWSHEQRATKRAFANGRSKGSAKEKEKEKWSSGTADACSEEVGPETVRAGP